jgi:ABC-type nitrate/sulfonate/bicarbonate transport system ATPase subunit
LRDAPSLILGEPLSAVDAITEARLDQTLAQVAKGKTTLVIAHRLATIPRASPRPLTTARCTRRSTARRTPKTRSPAQAEPFHACVCRLCARVAE